MYVKNLKFPLTYMVMHNRSNITSSRVIKLWLFSRAQQWRIQDFPAVGAPTLGGRTKYDFTKFSQKLHLIERIWTPGGTRVPRAPPLDPPLHRLCSYSRQVMRLALRAGQWLGKDYEKANSMQIQLAYQGNSIIYFSYNFRRLFCIIPVDFNMKILFIFDSSVREVRIHLSVGRTSFRLYWLCTDHSHTDLNRLQLGCTAHASDLFFYRQSCNTHFQNWGR